MTSISFTKANTPENDRTTQSIAAERHPNNIRKVAVFNRMGLKHMKLETSTGWLALVCWCRSGFQPTMTPGIILNVFSTAGRGLITMPIFTLTRSLNVLGE